MKKCLTALLMCFCMLITLCPASVFADTPAGPATQVQAAQPAANGGNASQARYAVVYKSGEMIFQATDEPAEGKKIESIYDLNDIYPNNSVYPAWSIYTGRPFMGMSAAGLTPIKKVIFEAPFSPDTTRYWFHGFIDLETIEGLDKLDTSNVTDMSYMFNQCMIKTLDLRGLDTSNVTDMKHMFDECYAASIDLSGLDTGSVTDMSYMFYQSGIKSLDLSGLDTSSVTDMSWMFANCWGLISLNLSGLDTSSVTDMSWMFAECLSLTSLDLRGFDTSKVTNMSNMFVGTESLSTLDLSGFDTSSVTDMRGMFYYCRSLTALDVSNFDTSNVTNMADMFLDCYALKSLDLSSFDTSNVTVMTGMFVGSDALVTIYAEDTLVAPDDSSTVFGCSNIVGGNGTVYDAAHVDGTYARIDKPGAPGYFTSKTPVVQQVETPVFDPAGGTEFEKSLDVTISCVTSGAAIYYTMDGSDPDASNGTFYTSGAAITLTGTATLKAVATADGYKDSGIIEATYTKTEAEPEPGPSGGGGGGGGGAGGGGGMTSPETPAEPEPEKPFPFMDVAGMAYYRKAVEWAWRKGITGGTSPTEFSPYASASRAQTVTFLWASAGCPEPRTTEHPFTDISERDYFYKAVLWAWENGITAGVSADKFGPDETVSRAQVITFLYGAVGRPESGSEPFADVSENDYFVHAVAWAYSMGITNGTSETQYSPYGLCQRCQIVQFLYLYYGE